MVDDAELAKIVAKLREQGTDDGDVEVKTCESKLSADIWESVSAFANTAGGMSVLGLSEKDGFSPARDFNLDRVRDQFIAGMGDGGQRPCVSNPPEYEMARRKVDGQQVLVIQINELDLALKPCYVTARGIQNGSYKRVDDKDIHLSATELYCLQGALMPSDAESGLVAESSVDDLDPDLVDAIIERRRLQTPRVLLGAETRDKRLVRLNIANDSGTLRLAGLLAAGIYPQQFYPKLVIDVAVHPGRQKSEAGLVRFLDRQVCDGPVTVCIEDAMAAIGRNLRKASVVDGVSRRDEWEIPEPVLREALANACVHREYSPMFIGQAVSVDIYPDRVEVLNPGGLWGGKTLQNLGDGDSRCRNPKLMNLVDASPTRPSGGVLAEGQGSGVPAMLHELAARGLPEPKFVAKADSFKVIFRRVEGPIPTDGTARDSAVEAPSLGGAPTSLSSRERLLQAVRLLGQASAQEIAQKSGVKLSTVRYHLPRLIAEGLIEAVGEKNDKRRTYKCL